MNKRYSICRTKEKGFADMNNRRKTIEKIVTDCIFLFLMGAVIGWLYEVLLHVVTDGTFVNRGMLHGPWLPIYGIGCLMIVGLKKLVGNRPVSFFAVSVAACGVVEYVTSWLMEVIWHMRWWDYSNFMLNLNGRIFVGGLLGFGAAGCLFVYGLLPILTKRYRKIPDKAQRWIAILFLVIFLIDMVLSLLCPNMGAGITNG